MFSFIQKYIIRIYLTTVERYLLINMVYEEKDKKYNNGYFFLLCNSLYNYIKLFFLSNFILFFFSVFLVFKFLLRFFISFFYQKTFFSLSKMKEVFFRFINWLINFSPRDFINNIRKIGNFELKILRIDIYRLPFLITFSSFFLGYFFISFFPLYTRINILDTSTIIESNFLKIVQAKHVFEGYYMVPSLVIKELHLMSDSSNKIIRQKGKKGLENLYEYKKDKMVIFPEWNSYVRFIKTFDVDDHLFNIVRLSNQGIFKTVLLTYDKTLFDMLLLLNFPCVLIDMLSKYARIEYLVNSIITVDVVKEGEKKNQAIGYTNEGYMIIIDQFSGVFRSVNCRIKNISNNQYNVVIFATLEND